MINLNKMAEKINKLEGLKNRLHRLMECL